MKIMSFKKIFQKSRKNREILVSAFTAVSVGIIIYQRVYNHTKSTEIMARLS